MGALQTHGARPWPLPAWPRNESINIGLADIARLRIAPDQIAIPQPIGRPKKRPRRLAGDKAYSYSRVRDWLRAHGIKPVIPRREDQRARHRRSRSGRAAVC